jgi:hypothetical protein
LQSFQLQQLITPSANKLADPWFAADKLQHLTFCAAVVVAVFLASGKSLKLGRYASLAAGILTSLVLGALKELGDHLQVCVSSGPAEQ